MAIFNVWNLPTRSRWRSVPVRLVGRLVYGQRRHHGPGHGMHRQLTWPRAYHVLKLSDEPKNSKLYRVTVCYSTISYGDGSKPWYLVNSKIAGKWMFIPLKMVLIGIDPYSSCYAPAFLPCPSGPGPERPRREGDLIPVRNSHGRWGTARPVTSSTIFRTGINSLHCPHSTHCIHLVYHSLRSTIKHQLDYSWCDDSNI